MPNNMLELQPGRDGLKEIAAVFNETFRGQGYVPENEVKITDKIDPTVRFIGAPISVLKPYLTEVVLPCPGTYMVQSCVRTQNVTELFDLNTTPDYGSYFVGLGALTGTDRLADMFQETSRFVARIAGTDPENVFISAHSQDEDLCEAIEANGIFDLKPDVMEPTYYKHGYGMEGVWGRNTSYWVKNSRTGEFEDIGNVIIIERQLGKLGVEFAFGDSTLLKQVAGLNHVLDAYDLGLVGESLPPPIRRRLEDCILTGMALYKEGLLPSARDNQTRILRSYYKGISLYRRLSDLSVTKLVNRIESIEQNHLPFDAPGAGAAIGKWLIEYETRLDEVGASNAEDSKILQILQTSNHHLGQ